MKNKFVAEMANVRAFVNVARSLESVEAGVPGMGLFAGCRGLGKTRTAIWYTSNNGSIYLRSKARWSEGWFLEELALELGIVPKKRYRDNFDDVLTALKEKKRLVVVDEINLPPTSCLESIRDIHDLTENPFLLIGHEGAVQRLKRLGPFFDRFLYITEPKPLSAEDLRIFADQCMDYPVEEEVLPRILKRTSGNVRRSIVILKGMENRCRLGRSKTIGMDHMPTEAGDGGRK